MRRSGWIVVAIGMALLAGGAGWATPQARKWLTVVESSGSLACPQSTLCFDVNSGQNVTHLFIDVENGCASSNDFTVWVDGREVPAGDLHTDGGPCNHGDGDIERTVWLPLSGNQSSAQVCVAVSGSIPSKVQVGAKSADRCVAASTGGACRSCTPVYPWWSATAAE